MRESRRSRRTSHRFGWLFNIIRFSIPFFSAEFFRVLSRLERACEIYINVLSFALGASILGRRRNIERTCTYSSVFVSFPAFRWPRRITRELLMRRNGSLFSISTNKRPYEIPLTFQLVD